MVTNGGSKRASDRQQDRRSRGQIILIGAITLAFIILGIVVVFNGVLYTETLSSTATSQSGSDANTIEAELDRGIGGVAHYGNINWEINSSTEHEDYESRLENVIIEDDGAYADLYRNSTSNNRPVVTEVERVAAQENATAVTNVEIDDTYDVVVDRQVGHFNLDLRTGGGGSVEIDTGSDSVKINDDGTRFSVDSSTCEIDAEHVRIDLVTGEVNASTSGDCELDLIDPDESYTITVDETADEIDGTYDLVAKGEDSMALVSTLLLGSDDEYAAAWTIETQLSYTSNDVAYTKTYEFDVYGDGS